MTIAYTLERLMTERAVIQRPESVSDGYGGTSPPVWKDHLTVPCRLWWDRSSGARSANRSYISPARTADVSQGGLIMPLGTDVLQTDQISELQAFNTVTGEWENYIDGTLNISAVLSQEDHLELDFVRTFLGG